MNRATWNLDLLLMVNINVRQVGRKNKIVRLHRGTQEQWTSVPDSENQFRQMPRATEENSMFAEAKRFNVPITVEDSETLAVFQNSCAVVGGRRSCGYVVLLGGSNFIQRRSPSVSAMLSGSRLAIRL